MGGQVQQVVTGQGGRMCTFCTDRTKRDTDTRLEHQERHRHTAPTQRGTETHDSNIKKDTDTRLEHQERHRHTAQTPRETQTHTPKTRGTQTHGSNTKRDRETWLKYKRDNTDTEAGHSQIQGLTVWVIYVQYMRLILC